MTSRAPAWSTTAAFSGWPRIRRSAAYPEADANDDTRRSGESMRAATAPRPAARKPACMGAASVREGMVNTVHGFVTSCFGMARAFCGRALVSVTAWVIVP